jgi:hypothetical protein
MSNEKFAIRVDNKGSLLKAILSFGKAFAKAHEHAHILAVSALAHAARTGDIRPLNAFYSVLPTNMQTSLRQYLGRTFKMHPTADCIGFKKDAFAMTKDTAEAREELASVCEAHLINPDGVNYKRFYEREIISEALLLQDKDVISRLNALLRMAKGEASGKKEVKSEVTKDVIAVLENAVSKVSSVTVN